MRVLNMLLGCISLYLILYPYDLTSIQFFGLGSLWVLLIMGGNNE